jgi:plastocyanin
MFLGLVGLIGLIPLIASRTDVSREIVLEARGMRFHLAGDPAPNPRIRVGAGERVRIVLRNLEPGMTHDFAVRSLGLRTESLIGEGSTSLVFRAPDRRGEHEYVCTPHSVMMRGVLVVQ